MCGRDWKIKNMDSLPERISTSKEASWKLRRDLAVLDKAGELSVVPRSSMNSDESGAAYENETGGTIGIATGRVTATIPKANLLAAMASLSSLGLQVRIVHEGKVVAVEIGHIQKLGALQMIGKIASLEGVEGAYAEVLMQKSKR